MVDGRHPSVAPLDDERRELAEAGELAVLVHDDEVIIAAPDTVGTLYRSAGVLALHSLDVREASIRTHAGMAVNRFVVGARFGRMPDPVLVRSDLARALKGELGMDAKLAEKERAYSRRGPTRRRTAARPSSGSTNRPRRPSSSSAARTRSACCAGSPPRWNRPAWTSARPGFLGRGPGRRRVLRHRRATGKQIPPESRPALEAKAPRRPGLTLPSCPPLRIGPLGRTTPGPEFALPSMPLADLRLDFGRAKRPGNLWMLRGPMSSRPGADDPAGAHLS